MYKSINLGRVVKGKVLLDMLQHSVLSEGLSNGLHSFYYMRNDELRKVSFKLDGTLSGDYRSGLGFNKLMEMSLSVAGNVIHVPRNLEGQAACTFEEARNRSKMIRCIDEDYVAIYGESDVTLAKFFENLAKEFSSTKINYMLNTKVFSAGITRDEFKKQILGGAK